MLAKDYAYRSQRVSGLTLDDQLFHYSLALGRYLEEVRQPARTTYEADDIALYRLISMGVWDGRQCDRPFDASTRSM